MMSGGGIVHTAQLVTPDLALRDLAHQTMDPNLPKYSTFP